MLWFIATAYIFDYILLHCTFITDYIFMVLYLNISWLLCLLHLFYWFNKTWMVFFCITKWYQEREWDNILLVAQFVIILIWNSRSMYFNICYKYNAVLVTSFDLLLSCWSAEKQKLKLKLQVKLNWNKYSCSGPHNLKVEAAE